MNINWKLRLRNKVTLVSIVSLTVSFVYSVLDAMGIVPRIDQNAALQGLKYVIDILSFLGIVVDPTTTGVSDSNLAMQRVYPSDDNLDLTVCEDPISDENEEVDSGAFDVEENIEYVPSDFDASI
jgi:phi LC3 family holin